MRFSKLHAAIPRLAPKSRARTWGTALLLFLLALVLPAAAETLQGTVTNGTTGKPEAGDAVVLLSLSSGMTETARTKTDVQGKFSFDVADSGPHLVRVEHQNVSYHKMAPPGISSVEVSVYDAVSKMESGLSTTVQIAMQSQQGILQLVHVYTLTNSSTPPRTLNSGHTLEVQLPENAQIDDAAVQGPGGQPVTTSPAPVSGKKGRYSFAYPLRPGVTDFRIAYHLPYNGTARIEPGLLVPAQHLLVMLPKVMQFQAESTGVYTPMGNESRANLQVATNTSTGQNLAFTVSGNGVFPEATQSAEAQDGMGGGTTRGPGGGLGAPIEAPDPLSRYRWFILGALGAVMIAGCFYAVRRKPAALAQMATRTDELEDVPVATPVKARTTSSPAGDGSRSSMLLEAMKEELFQLEVERQQGRISEQEYAQAKAALEQTIKRAVARSSSK